MTRLAILALSFAAAIGGAVANELGWRSELSLQPGDALLQFVGAPGCLDGEGPCPAARFLCSPVHGFDIEIPVAGREQQAAWTNAGVGRIVGDGFDIALRVRSPARPADGIVLAIPTGAQAGPAGSDRAALFDGLLTTSSLRLVGPDGIDRQIRLGGGGEERLHRFARSCILLGCREQLGCPTSPAGWDFPTALADAGGRFFIAAKRAELMLYSDRCAGSDEPGCEWVRVTCEPEQVSVAMAPFDAVAADAWRMDNNAFFIGDDGSRFRARAFQVPRLDELFTASVVLKVEASARRDVPAVLRSGVIQMLAPVGIARTYRLGPANREHFTALANACASQVR